GEVEARTAAPAESETRRVRVTARWTARGRAAFGSSVHHGPSSRPGLSTRAVSMSAHAKGQTAYARALPDEGGPDAVRQAPGRHDPRRRRRASQEPLCRDARDESHPRDPGGVEFQSGPTQSLVYPTVSPRGEHTVASWLVDDIEATVAELRDRGVAFEEYDVAGLTTIDGIATIEGQERAAWFKDSEGNTLALGEPFPQ